MNPNAIMRKRITIEDYLASRNISASRCICSTIA